MILDVLIQFTETIIFNELLNLLATRQVLPIVIKALYGMVVP